MGVCEQCLTAIRYLHDRPKIGGADSGISLSLPRYCHTTTLNCWICANFSDWLRFADKKILEDWRRHDLQVEYHSDVRPSLIAKPGKSLPTGIILPFSIRICPRDYRQDTSEDIDCIVQLNFVSSKGELSLLILPG